MAFSCNYFMRIYLNPPPPSPLHNPLSLTNKTRRRRGEKKKELMVSIRFNYIVSSSGEFGNDDEAGREDMIDGDIYL